MRRVAGALTLALVALLAPHGSAAPGPDSPLCTVRSGTPATGLTLLRTEPVPGHARAQRLTFRSTAMQREVRVEVVLPVGYAAHPTRRYPMLLLLHGHGGSEADWVGHGADTVLARQPWIVVTPDGGHGGWYSDWYGRDIDGHVSDPAPAWETFHLRELLPWVDTHYRTIGRREGRAIAGLSMGGFGATSYAARHPDLFAAVAAFSGAVDSQIIHPLGPLLVGPISNVPSDPPDSCIWGDPLTQEVHWRDHNPTELAGNLRGLDVTLMSGNGQPGRYDAGSYSPAAAFTEFGVSQMNNDLVGALHAAGLPYTTWFYGGGTHEWPYWMDDLARWAPQLAHVLGHPARTAAFDYESAEPAFRIYDWSFTTQRDVTEFTYLTGVGRTGLDLVGSGIVDVVTAALYRPGARLTLAGATSASGVAGPDGRLHFSVDLGTAHPTQQYGFRPEVRAAWSHATVRITAG